MYKLCHPLFVTANPNCACKLFGYMVQARDHIFAPLLYKQKQLIFCNLKELFFAFQEKHLDINIGFSKFCDLCPKSFVNVSHSKRHLL